MTQRIGLCALTLCVSALISACGGDAPQQRQDTQAADTQGAQVAAAPAAESKVGKIPMLTAASPAGKCAVHNVPASQSGASGIVRNIFYDTEFPTRSVRLALGDNSRAYPAINLEIDARQPSSSGTFEDTEWIWVLFHPNGDIRSGQRQYKASDGSVTEKTGLLPSDTAEVKQLIQSLIDTCR